MFPMLWKYMLIFVENCQKFAETLQLFVKNILKSNSIRFSMLFPPFSPLDWLFILTSMVNPDYTYVFSHFCYKLQNHLGQYRSGGIYRDSGDFFHIPLAYTYAAYSNRSGKIKPTMNFCPQSI